MHIELPSNTYSSISRAFKLVIYGLAVVIFLSALWSIIDEQIIPGVTTLVKLKAHERWPSPFSPIARFVANMEWDSKSVSLDASMSKAYQNKIKRYVWRIDDGTGLIGDGKVLQHVFKSPGYYTIKLSIIDEYDQSDEATCTVMIPTDGLQRVAAEEGVKSTYQSFSWVPEGTFFNFLKLSGEERSPGALKSRYVSSDCGLSNNGYNVDSFIGDFATFNREIKEGLVELFNGSLSLSVLGLVGTFLLRRLRRWTSN